ncbi:hypothetical protein EYF80_060171 [Liparis tanakae]|uniref:Uncharacterized protein n=1 Tax=Liparis tanakae TaxID=230148 RepID=A0A4Z2EMS7_9TELE|nr:hypothetical protein EYF80_060171 [Liparis tanakae]
MDDSGLRCVSSHLLSNDSTEIAALALGFSTLSCRVATRLLFNLSRDDRWPSDHRHPIARLLFFMSSSHELPPDDVNLPAPAFLNGVPAAQGHAGFIAVKKT